MIIYYWILIDVDVDGLEGNVLDFVVGWGIEILLSFDVWVVKIICFGGFS